MNREASEIVEQEGDKFKRWIKESIYILDQTLYYEQGRGSLSAFPHMLLFFSKIQLVVYYAMLRSDWLTYYLTIIPRERVGYEMIDSQRGA